MDVNNLSDLPEWDDERFAESDNDSEDWKPDLTRVACKAIYEKWREIAFMLNGLLRNVAESDDSMDGHTAGQILADVHLIGAKIISSEAGGIYIIRMGNAAIVRELAMGIYSSLLLFAEDSIVDEVHLNIVRKEIDSFRQLFIDWVSTFEKDEFVDEWGLFI